MSDQSFTRSLPDHRTIVFVKSTRATNPSPYFLWIVVTISCLYQIEHLFSLN